jgi:Na+:H+ antiporter, NhaA family
MTTIPAGVLDFFVVVAGTVAVVEDLGRARQRVLAVHGPGNLVGELSVLTDQVVTLTAIAVQRADVLQVGAASLRGVLGSDPALKELVLRALLLRRSRLLDLAAEMRIIGSSGDPDSHRLRSWAARHKIAHTFVDRDEDAGAGVLLADLGVGEDELPVVIWRGRQVMRDPSNEQLDAVVE